MTGLSSDLNRRRLLTGAAGLASLAGLSACGVAHTANQEVPAEVGGADELPVQTQTPADPNGPQVVTGTFDSTHMGQPTKWAVARPTGITGTLASPDGDKQLQLRAAALVLPVRVDIEQPGQHHGQRTLVRSMTIGVWLDTWTAPTRRHEAVSERPTRRDEASWLLRNAVQSALTWSQQGPQPVATLPPWNSPWKTPMVLSLAVEAPARDHKGHHSPGTGQPAPQLTIAFPSPDWRLPGRPLVTERLVVPAGHHCDSRKHAPT